MQPVKICSVMLSRLAGFTRRPLVNIETNSPINKLINFQKFNFHSSQLLMKGDVFPVPKKWLTYNEKLYPPQKPEEEKRPAYVCHMKCNIHYSFKKMWYIAIFVRGMSVDEAVKQLSFIPRKGAVHVKEAILEAQRLAVEKHNVEFKSNLWVAESFCGKALTVTGYRRHARKRFGRVDYRYSHYFVRLEEGPPPKQYYWSEDRSGEGLLKQWLEEKRQRTIFNTLCRSSCISLKLDKTL